MINKKKDGFMTDKKNRENKIFMLFIFWGLLYAN